jgi:hypothetical protein
MRTRETGKTNQLVSAAHDFRTYPAVWIIATPAFVRQARFAVPFAIWKRFHSFAAADQPLRCPVY